MKNPFEYPWIPDTGLGTYVNPVLHADYSDPDVIRHGEDFWMVASSINCTPGLPILHSRDLVNWTLANHAVRQVPHPRYAEVHPGCGIWAPAIRHHDGRFWIFFPMPDEGIYVTTAEDPLGRWCEPWLLQQACGWIDPCPFWDDDGRAYLAHAYANSRAGKKERIHLRPMSSDGRRLLGEGQELFHTPHHPFLEGPKVHKLHGWYYILAPGGGVAPGWQVVFRSRNIWGPYEEKVVLERGSTEINGPHQGALVDLPNGEWWFLHFQDSGPFGRIIHLQPVVWPDEWPMPGVDYDGNGIGEPVPGWTKPGIGGGSAAAIPDTTDEFAGATLGLQWQWHANHQDSWASFSARPGWLRLMSLPKPDMDLCLTPHFLGQKFPARSFAVETLLDFSGGGCGEIAGLGVVGAGHAALALRKTTSRDEFVFLHNGTLELIGHASSSPVRLRVTVRQDGECEFSFATGDGPFVSHPKTFTAREGGWIGAKIGLFSLAGRDEIRPHGHADFDYFRFSAPSQPYPPQLTAGFDERRAILMALGVPPVTYGADAIHSLASGGDVAAANIVLRRVAEWHDDPHPDGFAGIKLCRAWYLFGSTGGLEAETREEIRHFFLLHDFSCIYQSENHGLIFHSARYLMAVVFPEETFVAYGKTGAELREEDGAWLKRFLRYRAGHGWGEFDSVYLAVDWECLTCLFDFSPDAELRRLAGMMLDLLLADFEVDALRGMYGGAHGRIYERHALDHAAMPAPFLHYLYFGGEPPPANQADNFWIDSLTSSYRPHPTVVGLALNRKLPYENRERKHLHNVADVLPQVPLAGSIRKYTYWTPDYVMGCVQYQDPYPDGCPHYPHHNGLPVPFEQRQTAGYAHHQQHEWDLTFATRTDARLFTHHPGNYAAHEYWTGDRLCGCGHFFQNRSALIALYDIPSDQSFQSIHAYVPASAFEEIVEEKGFLFVHAGGAYGALRLLAGYRWTREGKWKDREIIAEGPRHGVVCEAGREADFGSFAAFRDELAANTVRFDIERMELEYSSRQAGVLRIDTRGGRWIDGASADLDYPTYGSPWLRAPWGASRVEVNAGEDQQPLTLDFSEASLPPSNARA